MASKWLHRPQSRGARLTAQFLLNTLQHSLTLEYFSQTDKIDTRHVSPTGATVNADVERALAAAAAAVEARAAAEAENEVAAWSKYREDWRLTVSAQASSSRVHDAWKQAKGIPQERKSERKQHFSKGSTVSA